MAIPAVTLIMGPEEFLSQRARQTIRSKIRELEPDFELHQLDAAQYAVGELLNASSPSLLGGWRLVEVANLESMTDAFLEETLAYLKSPTEETAVVLQHSGGNRGRKLVQAIKTADYPIFECQAIKKDSDKAQFVQREFHTAGRRIDPEAVRSLVTAVGAQLADLATACQQLISDVSGTVTAEHVNTYYGDRVEVTAFRVADAAVSGNQALALAQLRYALATGVDPVPLVAAVAMKVRAIAKVLGVRGSAAGLAKELGMAPWQIDQARREANRWDEAGLVAAIRAVADADAQVKGVSPDAVYALERAITTVAQGAYRGY